MGKLNFILTIVVGLFFSQNLVNGQCATWNNFSNKDALENDHSVYRQFVKTDDFTAAFEYWEKVYKAAPAADGLRDFHFTDGIKIYKKKINSETNDAKKKEYKAVVERLYDEVIACYAAGGIKIAKCSGDDCIPAKVAYLQGRKGFDMFYELNSSYSSNLEALESSMRGAGNKTEYIVFEPLANIVVHQFTKGKLEKQKAVNIHAKLNDIALANIGEQFKSATSETEIESDAHHPYAQQYYASIQRANAKFDEIANDIFDCEYFKKKWEPHYRADPDNYDNIKKIFNTLKTKGCADNDQLLSEIKGKYEKWARDTNAAKKAEFEANNPGVMANKMYKDGDFNGAINKYNEALRQESDPIKKAGYHSSIASIKFRKLKQYGDARAEARKALALRPGWGKPLNLIGDMYATGARNCGDAWNQRLAIIAAMDKYRAAAKDSEFADEANKKISKYRNSLPDPNEGFMRGVKKGDRQKVGCWISETVSVRYK